jgi:hypothetical protein
VTDVSKELTAYIIEDNIPPEYPIYLNEISARFIVSEIILNLDRQAGVIRDIRRKQNLIRLKIWEN